MTIVYSLDHSTTGDYRDIVAAVQPKQVQPNKDDVAKRERVLLLQGFNPATLAQYTHDEWMEALQGVNLTEAERKDVDDLKKLQEKMTPTLSPPSFTAQ